MILFFSFLFLLLPLSFFIIVLFFFFSYHLLLLSILHPPSSTLASPRRIPADPPLRYQLRHLFPPSAPVGHDHHRSSTRSTLLHPQLETFARLHFHFQTPLQTSNQIQRQRLKPRRMRLHQQSLLRRLLDPANKAQTPPTSSQASLAALSVWSPIPSNSPLVAAAQRRPEAQSFLPSPP